MVDQLKSQFSASFAIRGDSVLKSSSTKWQRREMCPFHKRKLLVLLLFLFPPFLPGINKTWGELAGEVTHLQVVDNVTKCIAITEKEIKFLDDLTGHSHLPVQGHLLTSGQLHQSHKARPCVSWCWGFFVIAA